jgi:hypothetical protein
MVEKGGLHTMNIIKKESVGTAIPETDSIEINQEQNTIPESLLKEFISIRERFLPLYIKEGLLSVEGDGIQLDADAFIATFPNCESEPFACNGSSYSKKLFATFEGVRFFCIK